MFRPFEGRQAFDEFFDQALSSIFGMGVPALKDKIKQKSLYPKVDTYCKDDNFIVEAAIPGLTEEHVKVEVDDAGILTISGEAQEKREEEGLRELRRSAFSRSWQLPKNVKKETVKATLKSGVLKVVMEVEKKEKEETPTKKSVSISVE